MCPPLYLHQHHCLWADMAALNTFPYFKKLLKYIFFLINKSVLNVTAAVV